ncbi:MAG TPA: hypothetical protein VGM89_09380 [Puia sp.]|jgi:hypothetical protein
MRELRSILISSNDYLDFRLYSEIFTQIDRFQCHYAANESHVASFFLRRNWAPTAAILLDRPTDLRWVEMFVATLRENPQTASIPILLIVGPWKLAEAINRFPNKMVKCIERQARPSDYKAHFRALLSEPGNRDKTPQGMPGN